MATCPPDDILLNKASIIEKCLQRIREEYAQNVDNLFKNMTKQDSIILNLERACEASIDIAMRMVKLKNLGIPQDSRDAFDLIQKAGHVSEELCERLKSMVGFRNIAVHDYQKLSLNIIQSIVEKNTHDLEMWAKAAIGFSSP